MSENCSRLELPAVMINQNGWLVFCWKTTGSHTCDEYKCVQNHILCPFIQSSMNLNHQYSCIYADYRTVFFLSMCVKNKKAETISLNGESNVFFSLLRTDMRPIRYSFINATAIHQWVFFTTTAHLSLILMRSINEATRCFRYSAKENTQHTQLF